MTRPILISLLLLLSSPTLVSAEPVQLAMLSKLEAEAKAPEMQSKTTNEIDVAATCFFNTSKLRE